jgi:hypothetical protein
VGAVEKKKKKKKKDARIEPSFFSSNQMAIVENIFDRALKKQNWNIQPKSKYSIPSSHNPLVNAARAIAVAAYPHPSYHQQGGKAERYSYALLAYIMRVSKLMGDLETLPPWAANLRATSMQGLLNSGLRNLWRAFTIRDLISSALIMKNQNDLHKKGERSTFTMNFKPDLSGLDLEIPIEKTVAGYILAGKIPDTHLSSLRAAILYHRPALARFEGPAVKEDGHDKEYDYQNVYTRHVKPALYAQHIVQIVWEAATQHIEESRDRNIPIDQILMRKAEWARDIHLRTREYMPSYIHVTRDLGVPSCWCEMLRFADPLADS